MCVSESRGKGVNCPAYDSISLKIDGMYKMPMSSGSSGRKGIY